MAWAEVWGILIQAFTKVFKIFFIDFTPLGAGISIGAFIFGVTILHKIIDILVPFAGRGDSVHGNPNAPDEGTQWQFVNWWKNR